MKKAFKTRPICLEALQDALNAEAELGYRPHKYIVTSDSGVGIDFVVIFERADNPMSVACYNKACKDHDAKENRCTCVVPVVLKNGMCNWKEYQDA